MIIDTHTHFYDPTRPQGVPWPGPDEELLYRRVLPEDHRALAAPEGVTGTVVVEASAWLEDNQWILDLAAQTPWIVGLVLVLLAFRGGRTKLYNAAFSTARILRKTRFGRATAQRGCVLN